MNKKSNIAIVLGSNIHWAPYYYRYEKILKDNNVKFDLIIWNRENITENTEANNLIEFKMKDKSDNKNPFKIIKFVAFSEFVKKTLKKNNYNKIIFLGTHGCAPIFLSKFLFEKYNQKYWLDIRDYQYEWFKPFFDFEKKSIENSFATAISSKGYEEFLPKSKYYYMHNVDPDIDCLIKKYNKQEDKKNRIRISFIGNVRYYEENIKLIKLFANDDRFILQYFGAGSENIKLYCEKNKINNVEFFGKFKKEDTVKFYNQTDIINNIYGNDSIGLTTALSNKLYYAVALKIPILVCDNTYMKEITNKYNFGITFKNEKDFPDNLYMKYNDGLAKEKNKQPQYEKLWEIIQQDEKHTYNKLNEFLQI